MGQFRSARQFARFSVQLAEDISNMFVAREDQDLIALCGELIKHLGSCPGARHVEVDKHVIEHHRQMGTSAAISRG